MCAILDRSNACFVTQTFASYAQTDASIYFAYTCITYNVRVRVTGVVARIAGQECFQIWKFNTFLRRETRPHTEGRRQTERRFLQRLDRVPLFSSRNLYAPA